MDQQESKTSPTSVTNPGSETKRILINDINYNITLLERGVNAIESRFISRVLRSLSSIRRQLDVHLLDELVQTFLQPSLPSYTILIETISSIKNEMSVDSSSIKMLDSQRKVLPEIELYFGLLIQLYLLDVKEYDLGIQLSNQLIDYIQTTNRRTSDLLASKIYFYACRFYELKGQLNQFHSSLLNIYRTATLRRDNESQATLINLLLRSYFNNKQYEQAEKLISKSNFPENVSNNQFVRYMYYLGRINAIQLDYSSAHTHLLQAIRKAPQTAASAGFLQTCNKLLIIIQLLMGELPERALFRQPMLKKSLVPYLGITQAVRVGDLNLFQTTLAQYSSKFQSDNNFTLILRLRHNVIKTGIRMISLSYSKISLREICFKLQLDSEQNVEYIVAKAIRDGVINATINHEQGYIQSKEHVDIYSTNEPQSAFHQRISFCLSLHNDSVKAMRFPMNAHRKELETAEEARERERELVKEISEADIDDDDEGDF